MNATAPITRLWTSLIFDRQPLRRLLFSANLETKNALMAVISILRLLWRKIRRNRKVYKVQKKQANNGNKSTGITSKLPTYLSFNRPHPPTPKMETFRMKESRYNLYYMNPETGREYWEITENTRSKDTELYVNDGLMTMKQTALRRHDANSNLQSILKKTAQTRLRSKSAGQLETANLQTALSRTDRAQTSLFVPICASTPVGSSDTLSTVTTTSAPQVFHRVLSRHLSVPKIPPPPPPTDSLSGATFVVIDSDDNALWEIEDCRTSADPTDTPTLSGAGSVLLTEDGVDLNETFIDEVTFYVDTYSRPSSALSNVVLHLDTKLALQPITIYYLSTSIRI